MKDLEKEKEKIEFWKNEEILRQRYVAKEREMQNRKNMLQTIQKGNKD